MRIDYYAFMGNSNLAPEADEAAGLGEFSFLCRAYQSWETPGKLDYVKRKYIWTQRSG